MIIVLGGSGASSGLSALANWILANGLGPAGFGLFSLATAIVTVLQELGGPAIDAAIVRFAAPFALGDPHRAEVFYRAGFRLKLLVSGALCVALVAASQPLADSVFGQPALGVVIRWMALCLVASNVSTIVLARLQSAERFVAHSILRILSSAFKVVLVGCVLFVGWLTPQTAAIVATLSFALMYAIGIPICGRVRVVAAPEADDRPYHEIIRFAKWVMLAGLMFAVHMRADVLVLGHVATPGEVGNYMVAWNLMLLIDLVTSSLVVALMPKAAKASSSAEVNAIRKFALLTGLGITLALLPLYLFAEPLIGVLFPQFPGAVAPFRLLFCSSIIVLMVYPLYLGFYVQNRPAKVSFAYALLATTSIASSLILVPRYGVMGAATSTLIARVIGAAAILALIALERPAAPRPAEAPDA